MIQGRFKSGGKTYMEVEKKICLASCVIFGRRTREPTTGLVSDGGCPLCQIRFHNPVFHPRPEDAAINKTVYL